MDSDHDNWDASAYAAIVEQMSAKDRAKVAAIRRQGMAGSLYHDAVALDMKLVLAELAENTPGGNLEEAWTATWLIVNNDYQRSLNGARDPNKFTHFVRGMRLKEQPTAAKKFADWEEKLQKKRTAPDEASGERPSKRICAPDASITSTISTQEDPLSKVLGTKCRVRDKRVPAGAEAGVGMLIVQFEDGESPNSCPSPNHQNFNDLCLGKVLRDLEITR